MVVPLRSQARLWHSLLHWAYFGLFRAQRAAFVRPCANACAVFRVCALRFAPCARRSSPSGLRVRTVLACFARAPAFAPCCANACAVFRSCALRVLAPSPLRGLAYWRAGTARHISAYALVAPSAAQCSVSAHCLRAPLVNPSVTAYAVPPPFGTKGRLDGGFWTVQLHAIVPLSKRLPCAKGAVGVSRLRDCLIMLSAKPTEGLPHYAAGASRLRSCLSCAPAFRMKASFSRYFVKSWGCRKTGAAAPFPKPAGNKHQALRGPGRKRRAKHK